MFESHVLHLLRRYLGEYVHGLSLDALRISVWKGDVILKDLKLKAEALNALKLPVTVKAGFVGTITLKVPWKSLGKEPVIVLIDRIFILAQPATDGHTLKEEDRRKLFEAKLHQIEEAELATLEATSRSKLGSASPGNSWLGSLIATIIGNLKISITNVHVRYEDSVSNPGHPFSCGVTLAKLAAVTTDEHGNETFDTSGALDKLRKSLQLERLAVYHNSDSLPWEIDKRWEDLTPKEWVEIFEDGINETSADNGMTSKWAMNRNYFVSPINGVLKYHRLGKQERSDSEIPFEKASLVLTDVSLTITEVQYHDWIKLFEAVSRYKTYIEISHLRPEVPVLEKPHLWWRYAAQAVLQQKKICYRLSWDQIRHLCQLRRRYVQLYASLLQQSSTNSTLELQEMEKDLDSKVILLWRLLAHAKVESVKTKEAAEQRRLKKKSWFSFRRHTESGDSSDGDISEASHLTEEKLTKEEWQAINNLLTYQPDEELMSHYGKDMHNTIQFLVTVSVGQTAVRIIDMHQTEIVCGRFEELCVSTKFKSRSAQYDVLLKYYGLSAPEGSLAQSVSSKKKVNALSASFVHSPAGENVAWKLSATISPCHITVLTKSFDRFFEFVKRSNAFSPTVALETANALQMKIEKVTRRAQEQFQMVLEEQSRFALDIDFDAPKVTVPIRKSGSSKCDVHFLLDFGHFTLHTVESQLEEQRQSIYSRFFISGRDIAALFTDCDATCQNPDAISMNSNSFPFTSHASEKVNDYCSLIDRCGMAVVVDQIKVPHPSYPSTRISIQVPNLGIHFSPLRYNRLAELLNILYSTMESCSQPAVNNFETHSGDLWRSIDIATNARILVWKGLGNSMATWQNCFLVLCGSYLYVMDSKKSQSYHRHLSMAGRQVNEVPPSNVGGSQLCISISSRGMDIQQALESSNTWVLEFHDEGEKATWLKRLIQATYQASAPPSFDVLGETPDVTSEFVVPQSPSARAADLVVNGALVEMKLCIYGKNVDSDDEKREEIIIIEVLASGGKVHMIRSGGDLIIKMKLHSLKIKDELQGRLSMHPQYLVCSVLKNDKSLASQHSLDPHEKEMTTILPDDDDAFKDALPDFLSVSDSNLYSPREYMSPCGTMGASEFESAETLLNEEDLLHRKNISREIFYETQGGDISDFVSVIYTTRSSSSPHYDGIDMQMSICMSKLEFLCNRPTIVALMGFGFDLSSASSTESSSSKTEISDDNSLSIRQRTEDSGHIKGLLGYGKSRVVFYFSMNVDSVTVFLNKEDDSQLAMLVQESFILDLKVHPSSLSVEGTLGNFRLCDMSLGADHCWSWLCDLRNPGLESLINFKFSSFSAEDDDYEGFDYSLSGRLSAVRIVFLYRFVQEITVYFMELATPHPEEAIKLVDKVGGFEWLIQKYEIDGATALKLDLSLDTPIIIVPRDSTSKDFIQLDLGQLQITNQLSWHGCPEKDPYAVHMDVLHAEILGINMFVGVDGCLGKPMIREGKGLDIFVRRSLRDVFRKVPTFTLEVKVDSLHGVMSNKEYKIIVDCLCMNLCEETKLPPSFRGSKSASKDTMRLLVDKVNMNSQILLSQTVNIVAVEISYALLELCNGVHESALALLALEGLWVSYRMTSLSETDLYVTIPKFSILDNRPDAKPEMRLMLGSSTDAFKQSSSGYFPNFLNGSNSRKMNLESVVDGDVPISTMFLMDYRWRPSSQSYVVRIQQPRLLVVPDFLLAVAEFFVPSLGTITGREGSMDPKRDPICRNISLALSEPFHKQSEEVVHFSPSRQLVADAMGVDEFIYDGGGKTICLSEETHTKKFHSVGTLPIIIIGRGKRLRFVNVKIENGSILRKHVYMSNDSSYSIYPEDGVEILLDNHVSDDEMRSLDYVHEPSDTSNTLKAQNNMNLIQSFTFEAQVVSPEFTFYDGTKSSLDDSLYGEKLLRAKMDLSFMYASKENDTWIRALVKDLTIESGSGLIILDPVDISGGYTSVKEKTNMSLVSTDICVHLSLSVISLLLNLQNQVAAALQFGNAIALVPCTSFDRIGMSHKENGPCNNLTFWRPQAPSNYVILGDCVTSRTTPPTQAVMAVSNTYGRVQKPVRFDLITFFSSSQGSGDDAYANLDNACSLWMPVAPPGYTALGCVAHTGSQPPPNHIVYCLRSDLVASSSYSECIYNSPPNLLSACGYSIWRLDNVIASFFAHSSTEYPPRDRSCDLSYHLRWNSILNHSSSQQSAPDWTVDHDHGSQQKIHASSNSSGWDVIRSVTRATNFYMSTPNFERIWWDKGSDVRRPVSVWRPIGHPGYAILGDCITEGLEPPALGITFKGDDAEISSKPVQFTKVAHIVGKGVDEVFFWYPVAPPGYASLGCVVTRVDEAPRITSICCPRLDLVNQANIVEVPISRSSSSRSSQCWSIWKVENQACTFLARSDLKKPSNRLAFAIGDAVKPKSRENITAEMKLRCFSITVLDSSCGMMKPLFDLTVTNIKLATHGRPEAMNAVLISSIAASTFNTQLEAWEPLVEPFDGIFKFETYDNNVHPPSKLAKRVRVAATSILNINVSAANLETYIGTILSWRKQLELDVKATKLNEEASGQHRYGQDPTYSALDEDDFQTITIENKLGCDMYLKKVEDNADMLEQLHHGDTASVWVPPPRFSDRLKVADEFKEARCYVAIQIVEAKDLHVNDDGSSHDFFCALRLVVNNQAAEQQKLFPQSARTKCVKPFLPKENAVGNASAKWNELFIFEIPRKGPAKLEVEVTNLGAKAGKGEVIGAFSLPVGHGVNMLKKVASVRMLHQPQDFQNTLTCPLRRKVQLENIDDLHESGCLVVSTVYFERTVLANIQKEKEAEDTFDRETGFWVRLSPEDAWESIRSLLPLSVVPKSICDDFVAMEIVLKNGKKHAIFRGLATVINDSDVKMDISVCHISLIHCHDPSSGASNLNIVIEEIFENQYYHPSSGWGSKSSGSQSNDPARWSDRDFSYSSMEFIEPPIPPGWKWTSTWIVDKSELVDSDGWAYGPNFRSLRWPPLSKGYTRSPRDVVRRRRWIRRRQQSNGQGSHNNFYIVTINPGSSAVLPWRSTFKDSDQCLQVRPCEDHTRLSYSWGRTTTVGSGYAFGKEQPFVDQGLLIRQNSSHPGSKTSGTFKLNQLEKKDVLLHCNATPGNEPFWISVGADASILHTELNAPVYDWKISINSPLKLENQLPCQAEFTIWEKAKEGSWIEQQHGIIFSRKSVLIYAANIHKPIYLTLLVQGGWTLEKDPLLILDLTSNDHASSFWIFHRQSKRRLRVSIERDMGGSIVAPKTIRFFVPYWILNSSSMPLTYRMVEIEPMDNVDTDSHSLSRSFKTAKTALRSPSNILERRRSGMKRNIQVIETIEDTSPIPSMLSPQDSASRSGVISFSSQKDLHFSHRVGLSVAIRDSDVYSPGIPLLELENKERVDIKAFGSDGSYHKLSALLKTSDRTKVVHLQPHTLFINRVGFSICLQQCGSQLMEWIHSNNPPKPFGWQSSAKVELLKLRVDGYKWSTPFSVASEGTMRISLKKDSGVDEMQLRVQVRSGTKASRFEVIFRPNSSSSHYRIENRSMFLPIRFRQVDGFSDSWKLLLPNAAASFLWEDLGRRHLLELLIDGADSSESLKYDIDEVSDHQPIHVGSGPSRALRITILREDLIKVVKISDWMPEDDHTAIISGTAVPFSQLSSTDYEQKQLDSEFHVILELAELGISVIDHTPEEILYLSVQNLLLAYSAGLGSGISRFKMRMRGLQMDNQLPITPTPVLFRPQKVRDETDYILKFSMTMQSNASLDLCVYPYIGFSGPDNASFLINIHEPIIWRLHEMVQHVNLSRLHDTQTTAVSVDPIIQIGVFNISEVRFKVSMSMSPGQRPRGVLGFWSSLMTALGNTENMPESKGVEDLGDVIREGGGALAKGLFRGVTGILTKPLEGAKSSGVEGFVQGVGKGIIGAAAQPVSGVLDLLSKTTEGANAMKMKIASAITSEEQLLRRRLPRAIGGDNLLRPYNSYKANGQVILQLAESGSFLGQVDLFKVRGKFALSDAYEDHFMLPKGKIVVVTHRRVMLLQQPSYVIGQRKFSPVRDPCSILWDVRWDDLMTMELTQRKKDGPKSPPSQVILYLRSRTDAKEQTRVLKCSRETDEALEVYSSIDRAMNIYGRNLTREMLKNKVTKPYSPIGDGSNLEAIPREGAWSPQQMPSSVPLSSTFGADSS
ncbi:hypothetical protein K2173_017484 [Erythroxylum novogranatense]|uniref:Uncharacterized protein n=1 Tax=Erythroxylum novogranatense TaxID=1862640 RepID=A0AAV8TKP1_9ROSI|nr:hypothetical protein K2173_017484 [Erythroxylum novogranatense]